jgi:hypothetical protein
MKILLLVSLSKSWASNITFLSFRPTDRLLEFGFSTNGTFDFEFRAETSESVRGFLLHEQQLADLPRLSNACTHSDLHITDLNVTGMLGEGGLRWRGSIPVSGVYYLYFWACGRPHKQFNATVDFLNPTSRLDTRDMVLPRLYECFVAIYAVIALIWNINAISYLNFRVPLHTIFYLLPLIRSVSLWISRSYWIEASLNDFPAFWKTQALTILEFLFYALNLTGISLASAGFCTYRQKFDWRDSVITVLSSALVAAAVLSAQFVQTLQQAFFVLGLVCFSIAWYCKQGIILVIVMNNLLIQLQGDHQVVAKVSLSRGFAISSLLTLFLTMVVSSVLAAVGLRKMVCAVVLESGLLLNAWWHVHYFMFKKEHCGDPSEEVVKPVSVRKPILLTGPLGSGLALLTQHCV